MTNRTIFETLDIGWDLLSIFPNPTRQLTRIDIAHIEKYHPKNRIQNYNSTNKDA